MELNKTVNRLWNVVLADSTKNAYETGFQQFRKFMLMHNIRFINFPPISEDILIFFIAHCYKNLNLQYSTIKLYLCGIRYKYIQAGNRDPLQSDNDTPLDRLGYILKSVKKVQEPRQFTRLPITFDILEKIITELRKGVFSPFIDLMLETVCTVVFLDF